MRLLEKEGRVKHSQEEPIRVAGVPVPQVGLAIDPIADRQRKLRRDIALKKYQNYTKMSRLFRDRLVSIGIKPIAIIPRDKWYEICRMLNLYYFLNVTDFGYVTVCCDPSEIQELNHQKLSQRELKRKLWPEYNNVRHRISGPSVKIILPEAPQEVQEVLVKVHQYKGAKNTDESAYSGGEEYIFAKVGVALDENSFVIDDDIGIKPDGKFDPIVFLNTHNDPGVTAIVAQYGEFNLEKQAVETAKKIIYRDF